MAQQERIRLKQLEYFIAVAETRSITRAAELLLVAQPSLSQQISALEREVGGPLLERLPRGVRLTAAGEAFYTDAQAALATLRRGVRRARTALDLESGELEIATVLSLAVGVLPTAVRAWHELRPGVTLRLREYGHADTLEREVASGVADLAVGPRPLGGHGDTAVLGWEEFVVVLPPDDELHDRDSVDLAQLADRNWVTFPPEHGLSTVVSRACARAGFSPASAVRTSQVEAATRLAAAGMGPAMVPRNVVPPGLPALLLPLRPRLLRELVIWTRGSFSPAAQSFVTVARGTASGLGPAPAADDVVTNGATEHIGATYAEPMATGNSPVPPGG